MMILTLQIMCKSLAFLIINNIGSKESNVFQTFWARCLWHKHPIFPRRYEKGTKGPEGMLKIY